MTNKEGTCLENGQLMHLLPLTSWDHAFQGRELLVHLRPTPALDDLRQSVMSRMSGLVLRYPYAMCSSPRHLFTCRSGRIGAFPACVGRNRCTQDRSVAQAFRVGGCRARLLVIFLVYSRLHLNNPTRPRRGRGKGELWVGGRVTLCGWGSVVWDVHRARVWG